MRNCNDASLLDFNVSPTRTRISFSQRPGLTQILRLNFADDKHHFTGKRLFSSFIVRLQARSSDSTVCGRCSGSTNAIFFNGIADSERIPGDKSTQE